jgi:hypothetical protein
MCGHTTAACMQLWRSISAVAFTPADHHDHSGDCDLGEECKLRRLPAADVVHPGLQLRPVCGQLLDRHGGVVCAQVPQETTTVSVGVLLLCMLHARHAQCQCQRVSPDVQDTVAGHPTDAIFIGSAGRQHLLGVQAA